MLPEQGAAPPAALWSASIEVRPDVVGWQDQASGVGCCRRSKQHL